MTAELQDTAVEPRTRFVWLEVTGRCQMVCQHCYADSGPEGTHGTMTVADWRRVLDEAAAMGVERVQFIGGEPTLYPHLAELVEHAVSAGLLVEVFTNMVSISDELWSVFARPGVRLATSYYSDDPDQHNAITGRRTHARTRANIAQARALGIELRAGVIDLGDGQRVAQARAELVTLGVARIGYDRLREIGRGAAYDEQGHDRTDSGGFAAQLCGGCGDGVAAIGPDGRVTPCVMARVTTVGTVWDGELAALTAGMPAARRALMAAGMRVPAAGRPCPPEGGECYPSNCDPRW